MTTIEKAPGWDWIVFYQHGQGDEAGELDVFGAMTIEDAVQEAHSSLSAGALMGVALNYIITGAWRTDQPLPGSSA